MIPEEKTFVFCFLTTNRNIRSVIIDYLHRELQQTIWINNHVKEETVTKLTHLIIQTAISKDWVSNLCYFFYCQLLICLGCKCIIYTQLKTITLQLLFKGLNIVSTEAASFHQLIAIYPKEAGLHYDQKYLSFFFQFIHMFFYPPYHNPWAAATFGSKQTSSATGSSAQQGALTGNWY